MGSVLIELIERHTDTFSKTLVFNIPITELNDDELRTCICMLLEMDKQSKEDMQRERDMMKLLRGNK